jgi:hypothetical protein
MTEQTPDAEPAAEPTEQPAEPVAEPVQDGKAALVGAPPGTLPEDQGGHAALVGHPDVASEVQPLQPAPETEQAQPDAAG